MYMHADCNLMVLYLYRTTAFCMMGAFLRQSIHSPGFRGATKLMIHLGMMPFQALTTTYHH